MLNKNDIQIILTFLSRVDLKGSEAVAYLTVVQKLNEMLEKESPVENEAKKKKTKDK